MYGAAFRLTGSSQEAEDLVQDALLKLWTKRDELDDIDNEAAFSITLMRNLFLDQQRKKHLKEADKQPEEYHVSQDGDPARDLESADTIEKIVLLVNRLPRQQRIVMTLRDIEGLSFDEIKAQTGLNDVNLRVLLSRARKAVREKISKK